MDTVRHTAAAVDKRLVRPSINLFRLLQIPFLGLHRRTCSRRDRPAFRNNRMQQAGSNDSGEIDASRTEIARLVRIGLLNGLPLPEHAAAILTLEASRVGIRTVVAHLGRAIPHTAKASLRIRQILRLAKGLVSTRQSTRPPHNIIIDKPTVVRVGIVKIEVHIVSLLALIDIVVQRLILSHARLVALFLGTVVSIDNHVVHNGLTPDGSSTAAHIIVPVAVATMVSTRLLRVCLVDVL